MYILPWVTLSLRKYSLHYITSQMEGSPVFLSYHTLLDSSVALIISGPIRSWNSEPSCRRLKLRSRYPGASHDYSLFGFALGYSFSHFESSTLGLPKHRVMHTHTCTHHTLVFDFALDIQRLCLLGTSIPHNSNLLVYGFALDTRTPRPSSLAPSTNRINRRISDT